MHRQTLQGMLTCTQDRTDRLCFAHGAWCAFSAVGPQVLVHAKQREPDLPCWVSLQVFSGAYSAREVLQPRPCNRTSGIQGEFLQNRGALLSLHSMHVCVDSFLFSSTCLNATVQQQSLQLHIPILTFSHVCGCSTTQAEHACDCGPSLFLQPQQFRFDGACGMFTGTTVSQESYSFEAFL